LLYRKSRDGGFGLFLMVESVVVVVVVVVVVMMIRSEKSQDYKATRGRSRFCLQ
jgi:uncharacterized membrane protein